MSNFPGEFLIVTFSNTTRSVIITSEHNNIPLHWCREDLWRGSRSSLDTAPPRGSRWLLLLRTQHAARSLPLLQQPPSQGGSFKQRKCFPDSHLGLGTFWAKPVSWCVAQPPLVKWPLWVHFGEMLTLTFRASLPCCSSWLGDSPAPPCPEMASARLWPEDTETRLGPLSLCRCRSGQARTGPSVLAAQGRMPWRRATLRPFQGVQVPEGASSRSSPLWCGGYFSGFFFFPSSRPPMCVFLPAAGDGRRTVNCGHLKRRPLRWERHGPRSPSGAPQRWRPGAARRPPIGCRWLANAPVETNGRGRSLSRPSEGGGGGAKVPAGSS